MKQISKAIISVMKEVKGMEKNSRVGAGTRAAYDGTKDQDVKETFNNALSKNGLCMLPIDIKDETKIDRWTDQYGKQKQSVFTKVNVKYLLLHDSGESIEVAGYGHGIDSQDKGAGKATTYAMKNALLYSFCTPVGKIEDTETTHSNHIEVPVKNGVTEKIPEPVKVPTEWISDEQMNNLRKPENKKYIDKYIREFKVRPEQEKELKELSK